MELVGSKRSAALAALVGESWVAPQTGEGVILRVRAGASFTFVARRPDGKTEDPPADRREELAAEVARVEVALAKLDGEAGRLDTELMGMSRADEEARAALETAEAERAELVPATPPRPRSALGAFFAWLVGLVARLFGRPRALASPTERVARAAIEASARKRRVLERRELVEHTTRTLAQLQADRDALEKRRAELTEERERRRRERDDHAGERHRRAIARLLELTAEPGPLEIEVQAAGLPERVVLLLGPPGRPFSEPIDGRITVETALAADALRARIEQVRDRRPAELARGVAAALCSARNRIVDLETRTRLAHQKRVEELTARRVESRDELRQHEQTEAQIPAARGADEIVNGAAGQLERLVDDACKSWEQRIESCVGAEQLRTEVAAVENGAAHRLSLVCDELREAMTIQFVRLVLELSRPLRQELLRKRLEVARGRSPKVEETFEDIRVVFPASLDAAFKALRTPELGALMSDERGIFDSLFRSLAREKRECVARLRARMDEVKQVTARELYAAAVYVSPLLLTTFSRLLDELLTAHDRWIEARLGEEQREYDEERARFQPALELVRPLEEGEARLAALLEARAAR